LIAIQESNADLTGIRKIMKYNEDQSCIFTDVAGNEERLCYIYKPEKISVGDLAGELAPPPTRKFSLDFTSKNGEKVKRKFKGFDRNPYVVGWQFNSRLFTTYNCHLYFGDEEEDDEEKFWRRILEVYTLTEWVKSRNKYPHKLFTTNTFLLGDMNTPTMKKSDPVYRRLRRRNMKPLDYHDHLEQGSNLKGDKYYDQLVVVEPFSNQFKVKKFGIFAWDNAVFASLWNQTKQKPRKRTDKQFRRYIKWAISDHRLLWTLLTPT